jgi:hypothetical protein
VYLQVDFGRLLQSDVCVCSAEADLPRERLLGRQRSSLGLPAPQEEKKKKKEQQAAASASASPVFAAADCFHLGSREFC